MSETGFTHQIHYIGWKRDSEESLAYPYIATRLLGSEEIQEVPLKDFEFSWVLSDIRYCTGYHEEDGTYHKCPYQNEAQNSFGQCIHCSKQIGFEEAFFYGGNINQRMQKHLAKPHLVYLAYFQPGIIKVGTAVGSRNTLRTIEQDALVAVFFAESDGFNIQQIERAVSSLGYTEAVKSSHKLKYIASRPDITRVTESLYSEWQSIRSRLNNSPIVGNLYEFESEQKFSEAVHSHIENPHIYFPPPERPLNLVKNSPNILTGQYRGLRGKYLITETTQLSTVSKNRVVGRYFQYSDTAKQEQPTAQPSLFDL